MVIQNLNASVAGEIRAELGRQHRSQASLAVGLGWNRQFLNRRMNGLVPFSTVDLEKIAAELGIDTAALTNPRQVAAAV